MTWDESVILLFDDIRQSYNLNPQHFGDPTSTQNNSKRQNFTDYKLRN